MAMPIYISNVDYNVSYEDDALFIDPIYSTDIGHMFIKKPRTRYNQSGLIRTYSSKLELSKYIEELYPHFNRSDIMKILTTL